MVGADNTRDKDTAVEVGRSRRYCCNTGFDQSQGRRPSTLKCIGSILISKGNIEPQPSRQKLIRKQTASTGREATVAPGGAGRYCKTGCDQSQGQRLYDHSSIHFQAEITFNHIFWRVAHRLTHAPPAMIYSLFWFLSLCSALHGLPRL